MNAVNYGGSQTKSYLYDELGSGADNTTGLLTGIISEDQQRYGTFKYDSYGRVVASVLEGGTESTEVSYPDATHAVVKTMTGEVRTYTLTNDLYRKPLSIASNGYSESSTYDGLGRMLSHTDGNGVQSSYVYDGFGRIIRLVEAENDTTGKKRTTETDWDIGGPVARRVLDANSTLVAKQTWSYNTRGQVLTHTFIDPVTNATRTTTTAYCEDASSCGGIGLVTSIDGPRTDINDVTTYSYYLSDDPSCTSAPTTCPHRKGDLWKVTNALGQVTETLTYDGAGRVLSVKDPNSVVTDYTYTARGWLASKTVRGGGVGVDRQTRIEYWPTGLVSFVYQPDNSFTAFTYDSAHRLTDVYDNAGNKIHYTLDNAGNRTREDTSDPSGTLTRTLARVYNQLGQVQQTLTANNHATTYTYDPNGNTTGVSDALGRNSTNIYDPLGRLVKSLQDTSGINANTQFTYDANDHLTQVIDPKGLATSYSYNGFGDLLKLISPDTQTTSYTYNAAGNRLTQTDARGIVTNYVYDALNRLTAIKYSDTTYNQSYTYDTVQSVCLAGEQTGKGMLTAMQAKGATTRYCYDRWGQLVRKTQIVGSLTQVTRYGYDAYGRQSSTTYPDGGVVDYVRNALGQINEVGYTPAGGARSVMVTGVTYAPFGPAIGWNYGNGRTLSRTLTLDYRPNTIYDSQVGGLSYAYGFDAVGNLGALKDGTQTNNLGTFVYDGLNRLTQQQNALGSPLYTWSYDVTGNRTSAQSISSGTQTYTYETTSHRLSKVAAVARTYDAMGNTVNIGGTAKAFAYGPESRMSSVSAAGKVTMAYAYNARGEQVKRSVGSTTYVYAYDEAGHYLGEYTGAGVPRQQVIWLDDLPVGVVTGTGTTRKVGYIEPDHLGTPRTIIDATRNVAIWNWPLTGEPFGNVQPDQDPDHDGVLFTFDLRFPGQRYDSATGLNQNRNRDYDVGSARYVESDPIGLGGGISTFAYVQANPFIAYDKSGLASVRLPPLDPGKQLPSYVGGTTYCQGGEVKPYVNQNAYDPLDFQCYGDCALAHEQAHVADYTKSNPGVCKYWGWVPFIYPRGFVSGSMENDGVYKHPEYFRSEFHAYSVELRCLAAKLRASSACTSDRCKERIEARINDIIHTILPTVEDHTYGQSLPADLWGR